MVKLLPRGVEGKLKRKFTSNWYVKARRISPEKQLRVLRKSKHLKRLAEKFQPSPNSIGKYKLRDPLEDFRMLIPSNCVYPMVWGEYEKKVCAFLLQYLKPGWRVIDAGAHIGYFSLLMGKCVGSDGKVFSFEPLAENLSMIFKNIALNRMYDIINVIPMALAEKSSLSRMRHHLTSSQAFLEEVPQKGFEKGVYEIISTCSVDDYFGLLDWPQIHFVKMDIEGSESRAIAGMHELINRHKPVFLVETHGEVARDGIGYLLEIGYEIGRLRGDGSAEKLATKGHVFGNEHYILLP
jgi:FkbM family methyltransferase